jgi:hypothetical protein
MEPPVTRPSPVRNPHRAHLFSASLLALVVAWAGPASAEGPEVAMRVAPDLDWAFLPDDDLRMTDFERFYGIDPETLGDVVFEQDGMVFGRDSNAASVMAQHGLPPLPAVQYDPTPGVLYVAMNGVTLSPGQGANAALNRTPLVSQETTFPSYGSEAQRTAVLQALQTAYGNVNLVISSNRPPEYLPYTMAVVGGSAAMAGQPSGVCGVANVQCDALQRNHVSLTFPQSWGGVGAVTAHEAGHNFGLEHVTNSSDLMYPYNTGQSSSFLDGCTSISHATGSGVTQCGHIHREYCNGDPDRQNGHAEMFAAFGPRTPDDTPPEIVELFPADGSVLTTEDSFTISARVTEDSNFLGVKWTWLEGPVDEGVGHTRCTNGVCADNYGLGVGFDPDDIAWDFLRLTTPPEGTYKFRFEIMDAYGNADAKDLTIQVVLPGNEPDSGGASGSGDAGDGDSAGDGTGGFDSDGDSAGFDGGDGGRGCTVGGSAPWTWGTLCLLALVGVRRRSRVARS